MTTLRLILAILVACYGMLREFKNPWPRVRGFWFTIWDGLRQPKTQATRYEHRLAICRKCPIFYPPLQTCGSPLSEDPSLGCWCNMEIKAKLLHASCWTRDHGVGCEHGAWPIGL